MLGLRRAQIIEQLTRLQIPFRQDSSNGTLAYTRNRIRNELIPSINSIFGDGWQQRLLETIDEFAQVQGLREVEARDFMRSEKCQFLEARFQVPLAHFRPLDWSFQREILVEVWHRMEWPLREMDSHHWLKIRSLIERSAIDPHPQRTDLPGRIRLEIRKGILEVHSSKSSYRES
jgi:tRNA(Ile)-lysidine synthase